MSSRLLRCRDLAALLLLLFFGTQAFAQDVVHSVWMKPAHDLVEELLTQGGSPSSVTVTIENRSSMTSSDIAEARKALDAQFRSAKVTVVKPDLAIAEIKFTFSENLRGFLWIADVKQGLTSQISMLSFPRPTASEINRSPLLEIRKTHLHSQSGAILDVASLNGALLILERDKISLHKTSTHPTPSTDSTLSWPVTHLNTWPRDLRGRLYANDSAYVAFFPGVSCSGTVKPTFTAQCRESDDPWPLSPPGENVPSAFFAPARNFFSGVLGGNNGGMAVPSFYTAARLGDEQGALWALLGVDGRTRLYRGFQQPIATLTSPGGDIAAVQSACGSGRQLLVTSNSDGMETDFIQAFEIQNKSAVPVSDPMTLEGSVTALWTGADSASAVAVIKSRTTDTYEVFSLSITCSR